MVLRQIVTPVVVSFFFLFSGFLWYQFYMKDKNEKAKLRIIHILKLYCIWSLIYFPFVLIQWLVGGDLNNEKFSIYRISYLKVGFSLFGF